MLLIDEPEAFLHPEAIRQLSASLYEIGNIMPIVITTHSPVLINLENDHTVIDIFKGRTSPNLETLRLIMPIAKKILEETKEMLALLNIGDEIKD